jgi:hypothetical protein
METRFILMGAAAALAIAGIVYAQTNTETSGNSTSTITQEGGGTVKRTVTKTPDGQTIVQESGGSKSTVVQKNSSTDCTDGKTAAGDGCTNITEPKDLGPGFDRAQALKEKMDAMKRQ